MFVLYFMIEIDYEKNFDEQVFVTILCKNSY